MSIIINSQTEKINFPIVHRVVAAVVFLLTLIVYSSTVAPTVSFWDCGEFIACCHNLAITHPPGAPLYILVGRLFSIIPFTHDIALRINFISVLCSALTILLLYLSIVLIVWEYKGGFKTQSDWLLAISAGLLGCFSFAFTHSFWFNAVEAEVYAPSMFLTSLIIWLSLYWAQNNTNRGNDKIIMITFYLLGLSICIHLLNILVLPFITMIYYYKRYRVTLISFFLMVFITTFIFLIIYLGIVKTLPLIYVKFGLAGLLILFIGIILFLRWTMNTKRRNLNLIIASLFLLILGYSTYTSTIIRSGLNPSIDMNNPESAENFQRYINREQYGDHNIIDRTDVWKASPKKGNYDSAWDYLWKYQINKMYIRYFLWQFVGMDDDGDNWDVSQLYALPLILGMVGIYWHFKKDSKHALALLSLFLITGLILVLYLNQSDPQPRERDYTYVVSFFTFSFWIGMSYLALYDLFIKLKINFMQSYRSKMLLFLILVVLVPGQLLVKNYSSHNRGKRYFAWDYAYNMLQSCKPNAILFTGGDNDTYPLWYLQGVENIRKDVRIINLELLNTPWYIQQLRDLEPKVPMNLQAKDITRLGFIPWKKKAVSLAVSKNIALEYGNDYEYKKKGNYSDPPNEINFEVAPTFNTPYGPVLCLRDSMLLRILQANNWRKPIYFSASIPQRSYPNALRSYLRMDGLVLELVPYKDWHLSPHIIEKNLLTRYRYRGLQQGNIYCDKTITAYTQNYRCAFLELAGYYAKNGDLIKLKNTLIEMEKKISTSALPWISRYLRLIRDSYLIALGEMKISNDLLAKYSKADLMFMAENLMRVKLPNFAQKILEQLRDNTFK